MTTKPKNEDVAGGQAVIEGVMMRHGNKVATAVRLPDKSIVLKEEEYIPFSKRVKVLGVPFIRGFVNLIDMMKIGMTHLLFSAEVALEEDQKKAGKWELPFAMLTSLAFSVGLFVILPAFCFTLLKHSINNTILLNITEGLIRFGIFMAFLSSTLLMEDMRRVFMYHGAEHKTVFAWENGQELTVENIKAFSTRHPRCGTSFLLIVMLVSIITFTFLGRPDFLHRVVYKLMLFPVVSGISYEIIRFTGKHQGKLWVRIISWPGLMLQKITTREPSDDQIEVAITAMKKVI